MNRAAIIRSVLRIGAQVGACLAMAGNGMAHADPPPPADRSAVGVASASAGASSPTIAVVTLQTPKQEAESEVIPPPADADPGLRFEDLPQAIGLRVRVLTVGQSVHRGVIRAADSHRLTLSIKRAGGSATYKLLREQVQRIDPD
jgi:hypothetical protein